MNHDVMKAPTRQEALHDFMAVWGFTADTEYVPLGECLGRVTAENILAVNILPAGPISAMDGYAVKAENFAAGTPDVTAWVPGVDFTPADTGDDVPDEYDAVIPVEQLQYNADGVPELQENYTFKTGANIRPAGCMIQPGDLLAAAHTRITPELRAAFAAGGVVTIPVIRKPVVAYIPTGSELTPAGLAPRRGENIESNSLMLSDYLTRWGAKPVCLPIVRDDPEALERAMDGALRWADIVLLNGGSSKGTEDFNSLMLERRGSWFHHTVRTVPGRPVGLAIVDEKPVINLPGPVLAAWVVSDWLLRPMVCRWLGVPVEARRTVTAFLTGDLKKGPPVELYTRVRLEKRGEFYYASPLGRGCRTSESLRDGLGILIAPIGSTGWEKNQPVTVELLVPEEIIPRVRAEAAAEAPVSPEAGEAAPEKMSWFDRMRSGSWFHSSDPAANALVECAQAIRRTSAANRLHGGDDSALLNGLTDDEKAVLLALLRKQQACRTEPRRPEGPRALNAPHKK